MNTAAGGSALSRHHHPISDPDPFSPEDGYALDRLVTPACDDKGHTAQRRIAFKPDVFPVLARIVASNQFDYRSPEDIVRDAVYHRVWYLADQLGVSFDEKKGLEGEIHHLVSGADHIAQLERLGRHRSERARYVETLEAELDGARRTGDLAIIQALLAEAKARLEENWLHEPYRSQVEVMIDKAERGLL